VIISKKELASQTTYMQLFSESHWSNGQ